MNSAVLIILIVVGLILCTLFSNLVENIAGVVAGVAILIGSVIGLYHGIPMLAEAVQKNDGVEAAFGLVITLVCGAAFIGCILAAWIFSRQYCDANKKDSGAPDRRYNTRKATGGARTPPVMNLLPRDKKAGPVERALLPAQSAN